MTNVIESEFAVEDLIELGAISVETKGSAQMVFDGTQSQLRDPIGLFVD